MSKSLIESVAEASVQGASSYLAIRMLDPNAERSVTAFGRQVSIPMAMGMNVALVQLLDDILLKRSVIPMMPTWIQPYLASGNFVGDAVLKSGLPIAYLRYANPNDFSDLGALARLGVENLVGAYTGGYVYRQFGLPLLDRAL